MISKISTFSLVIILMITSSCQKQTIIKNETLEDAVSDYYEGLWNFEGAVTTDIKAFVNLNRDEILNTLYISEIQELENKNVAIVFVRFSVSTQVVHQGLWFQKMGDSWYKTGTNSMDYNYEMIGFQEKDDELEEIIEKKEEWEENNSKAWWIEYF